jgi:hypothetical protein
VAAEAREQVGGDGLMKARPVEGAGGYDMLDKNLALVGHGDAEIIDDACPVIRACCHELVPVGVGHIVLLGWSADCTARLKVETSKTYRTKKNGTGRVAGAAKAGMVGTNPSEELLL